MLKKFVQFVKIKYNKIEVLYIQLKCSIVSFR